MYIPLRFFGLASEKQIIAKVNINSDKFELNSVEFFNQIEKLDFKKLFKELNKNLFCEVFALHSGSINYLTYKSDVFYNVKVAPQKDINKNILIFDISSITRKFANKLCDISHAELIVDNAYDCFVHGSMQQLGKDMITYWKILRTEYPYVTNIKIDKIYSDVILTGGYGCSLDENFLIVVCPEEKRQLIINKLKTSNIENIEWSF